MTHLTEDERHGMADGTLEPTPHLEACAECAADVDRIRRLMKRVDESKTSEAAPAGIDEAWRGIRARIEERKVVGIGNRESEIGNRGSEIGRRTRRGWAWAIGGVAAAGLIAALLLRNRAPADPIDVAGVADTGVVLVALVDSTHAYQEQAQELLNHFELQRATMRPELARAFERDLKTIDVAIAELQDAIRNDPANPALRRLLASSFRQKVDLLKRAGNATG